MISITKKNILLTGPPGVGKTTLIKHLSKELISLHPTGFYTEEIKEGGIRKGFTLISFSGKKELLSHIDIKSPYRVGKYRIDVKGFEDFLDTLRLSAPETNLVIIDEIGKMECMSSKFRRFIKEILDSEKLTISTIALKGGNFIEGIKKRNDVKSFQVTQENRDYLLTEILKEVSRIRQMY